MSSTRPIRRFLAPAMAVGAGLALASTASAAVWFPVGAGVSGPNASVNAIATDAAGHVFAGGTFTQAGGTAVSNVARWDGTNWHPMDAGLNGTVYALTVDSTGKLYAGGSFTASGATAVTNVARWDGAKWDPVATGVNGTVYALTADTSGNVYAGGAFTTAGAVPASRVAKWNGVAWTPLGTGTDDVVQALTMDTSGNLYAGGAFANAGGVGSNRVARWNGAVWQSMPGIAAAITSSSSQRSVVNALAVDSVGRINAGGSFSTIGQPNSQQSVARFNGSTWVGLGTGTAGAVNTLLPQPSANLMVGGNFSFAGPAVALNVANWNSTQWTAVGGGINNPVQALHTDAQGNVYAGGTFTVADGVQAMSIAVRPAVPPAVLPATAACSATFYQQAARTWKYATSPDKRSAVKVISRIRIFQEAQPACQTNLTFILRDARTKQRLAQLPGSTLGYRTLQGQDFSAPVISWPTTKEFRFNSGDLTGQNRVNARLVLVSYLQRTVGMPSQANVELVIVRQIPTDPALAQSATNPLYAQTNALGTTINWAQVN